MVSSSLPSLLLLSVLLPRALASPSDPPASNSRSNRLVRDGRAKNLERRQGLLGGILGGGAGAAGVTNTPVVVVATTPVGGSIVVPTTARATTPRNVQECSQETVPSHPALLLSPSTTVRIRALSVLQEGMPLPLLLPGQDASNENETSAKEPGQTLLPPLGGRPTVTSVVSSVVPTVAPTTAMPTTSSVPSISSTPTTSRPPSSTQELTSTVLTTVTNAEGSASVSTALVLPTLAANNTGSNGSTGKTWGIVGGVVGGIAVLAAALFVLWRFTQRRFSDLDDARDDIKWPELQPDGLIPASSTLNPLGTRRTGGAGVEMGDLDGSEWGDGEMTQGRGGEYYDDSYAPSTAGAYYDPYLGPSAAPHPAPPNLYPPSQQNPRPYSPYYSPESNQSYSSPPSMHPSSVGMGGHGRAMSPDGMRGGRPM